MLSFNQSAWMLFYGLPSMFFSAVSTPKRALIETFETFASLPESQRNKQSWGVQPLLIAQEIFGTNVQSRVCMLIIILWAWVVSQGRSMSHTLTTSSGPMPLSTTLRSGSSRIFCLMTDCATLWNKRLTQPGSQENLISNLYALRHNTGAIMGRKI